MLNPTYIRIHNKNKHSLGSLLANFIAVCCALNINGLIYLSLGIGEVVSPLLLLASVILIIKYRKIPWSWSMVLLFLSICMYLVIASFYYDDLRSTYRPFKYYRAYGGGMLVIWSIALYTKSLGSVQDCLNWLLFLRNCFLISAASVCASPILYHVFNNIPPSAGQRLSGFFGNPNEASIASLYAVGLLIAIPLRKKFLQYLLLIISCVAILLTLSKSGISALIILLTWHLFNRLKSMRLLIVIIVSSLLLLCIQVYFIDITIAINNAMTYLGLDSYQQSRILAIGKTLSLNINDDISTQRTYLWEIILNNAIDHFPLGGGLGSAHHIVGGIYESNVWQGAHNTFIMILGESGPLPALLLILTFVNLMFSVLHKSKSLAIKYSLFILIVSMMVSHGSLGNRFDNLMLGTVMGVASTIKIYKYH